VTEAFREDPVRILRLARFAARFHGFSVAPETVALMRQMVAEGEVDALVPERVWQELARGLMEARPSRMFEVLRDCGALARLLPELDRLWGVPQRADYHPEVDTGIHVMMVLDRAAQLDAPLPVRWACLAHDLGKGTTPADVLPRHIGHEERSVDLARQVQQRLRVPSDCAELALVVAAARALQPLLSCACSSAATRSANPIDLRRRCWPASAMRRGGWGWKTSPTRNAHSCCACWLPRKPSAPRKWQNAPPAPAAKAPRLARWCTRRAARRWRRR